MHELSMCESLLAVLSAEYDRFAATRRSVRTARVTRVRLIAGGLHQIEDESMCAAWKAVTEGTVFEGAVLDIERIPLAVRCRACGWEGEIKAPFFLCGRCGGGEVDVVTGMELYVQDMEVEDDESENLQERLERQ